MRFLTIAADANSHWRSAARRSTWPRAARAQQPAMPVLGILDSAGGRWMAAFRAGLSEAGQIEGRNVAIELRSTEQYGDAAALAAELVGRRVAVIAALGGPAANAAKAATATIPIVFSVGGDSIELGLVARLDRPGGNMTGVTFSPHRSCKSRSASCMRVPKATVLGVLINPNNPRHQADANEVQAAARTLALDLHVAQAGSEPELDAAFAGLVQRNVRALIVAGDAFFFRVSPKIIAFAQQDAIAAIYNTRETADAGGLMSYATSLPDAFRQAGIYPGEFKGREARRSAGHRRPNSSSLSISRPPGHSG